MTSTATTSVVASMLKENTGTHFLDSGGAYGRAWQRNQAVPDEQLVAGDVATVDFRYGDVSVTLNVGPWLAECATISDEGEAAFRLMDRYLDIAKRECNWLEMMKLFPSFFACYRARNRARDGEMHTCETCSGEGAIACGEDANGDAERECDDCGGTGESMKVPRVCFVEGEYGKRGPKGNDRFELVDADVEDIGGIYGEGSPMTVNTYNGEDLLSQTLQYHYFTIGETDRGGRGSYEQYVVLQVHGGADVRGGYTRPRVFSVDIDDGQSIFDNAKAGVYCTGKGPFEPDPNQLAIPGADVSTDTSRDHNWSTDDGCNYYFQGTCGRDAGTQLEEFEKVQLVSAEAFDALVAEGHEPDARGVIATASSHRWEANVAKTWIPGVLVFAHEDVTVNDVAVSKGTGFCPHCGGILAASSY
jgi:hypothetical protein